MHLRRLWTIVALLTASAAGAAVVYKWTDADGVVHFSDTAVPGAEKIVTSSATSNGIGGPTARSAQGAPLNKPPGAAGPTQLAIESPTAEQVFFNDEAVPVRLHIEPAMKPGRVIVWHLNGRQLTDQAADAVSFVLQNLERGTYAIAATVTDTDTNDTQTSASVTFYVRQPSELSPQHKKS